MLRRHLRRALRRADCAALVHSNAVALVVPTRHSRNSSGSAAAHSPLPEPEPEQALVPRSTLRPLGQSFGADLLAPPQHDSREVTLYVRGFMSSAGAETGDDAAPNAHEECWRKSHAQLVEAHGWSPHALAYEWKAVGVPDLLPAQLSRPLERLRFLPMPAVTIAAAARVGMLLARARFGAAAAGGLAIGPLAAGAVAADTLLHAGRLVAQYRQAAATSQQEAGSLRVEILKLRSSHDVVRVVAHSLGCRMLLHACEPLPHASRPDEVHLLAAAVTAAEALPLLPTLSQSKTHAYFSKDDLTLGVAFRVIEGGAALGYSGLEDMDLNANDEIVISPGGSSGSGGSGGSGDDGGGVVDGAVVL